MNLQPILGNELISLQPITDNDFEALFTIAADPLIWEQHPDTLRYKREVFKNYFDSAIASKGAFLIIDNATHEIIGSSRYYELDNNQIAIGYTFIAREYWGKAYNKQLKNLMINYAFMHVEKVVFYIGCNNIRSQKAIEKIGAKLIGTKDDSLVYGINKTEWNKNN